MAAGGGRSLVDMVRQMSVAWFSFNLATSAVILASFAVYTLTRYEILLSFSRSLAYLNTMAFAVIVVMFILRLVLSPRATLGMFLDPVRGPFTATISIAVMLLALDWSVVLKSFGVAAGFFYAGLVLHTLITLVTLYSLVMHPGIEVAAMNPGWYMPAVGNVLVPYIGSLLSRAGYGLPASLLGAYLGSGVIFWMALFTIWLYRSIFHHPPPARLLGAAWINLAPPAVIPLAYEALLGFTPPEFRRIVHGGAAGAASKLAGSFFSFFYYTFWGLDLFLLALVALMTLAYLARGEAEFAESWWALVFPQAAYAISTVHLYLHYPDAWLRWLAVILYVSAVGSYITVSLLSLYYGLLELRGEEPRGPARPLE